MRSWYAEAKARKKRALVEKLKAAFMSASGSNRASSTAISVSEGATISTVPNAGVGGVNRGNGEVKRIINDLQFGDIPAGMYEYTTQSLLSMLMKQDARIKVLERTVELLLAERES